MPSPSVNSSNIVRLFFVRISLKQFSDLTKLIFYVLKESFWDIRFISLMNRLEDGINLLI